MPGQDTIQEINYPKENQLGENLLRENLLKGENQDELYNYLKIGANFRKELDK